MLRPAASAAPTGYCSTAHCVTPQSRWKNLLVASPVPLPEARRVEAPGAVRPPCEIVVFQLLPALRALIGYHLIHEYGFTQSQVAEALGVTQASVSRSLAQLGRFEHYYTPSFRRAARVLASQLAKGESMERGIAALCSFCRGQKVGGLVCRLHRRENPSLAQCRLCIEGVSLDPRSEILGSLIRGAQILESSPEFASLIPQVQTQLVMSLSEAKDVDDVAGFPGRIANIGGKARALTQAEFGASAHLARMLLEVQKYMPQARAAIVFKYMAGLEAALDQLNLTHVQISRKSVQGRMDTDEALLAGIRETLEEGKPVNVLIDRGGVGIEAVAYLFAADAEKAANLAIKVAQLLHH